MKLCTGSSRTLNKLKRNKGNSDLPIRKESIYKQVLTVMLSIDQKHEAGETIGGIGEA